MTGIKKGNMPRRTLDPIYKEEIRSAYYRAQNAEERNRIIDLACKTSGYSYGGLMKVLRLNVRSRSLCDREKERIAIMDSYAMKVWDFQLELSHGMRSVST